MVFFDGHLACFWKV